MPEPEVVAQASAARDELQRIVAQIDELILAAGQVLEIATPIHGYHPGHLPVICGECEEEFTGCQLGNYYCPSCQSGTVAEATCAHCEDDPCHYCGKGKEERLST